MNNQSQKAQENIMKTTTKWTSIVKKTELRKLIKNSIGNTGSLDFIEFYSDGSWTIMGCSTSGNCVRRINIAYLAANFNYSDDYTGSADFAITHNFNQIEYKINEV